MPRYFLEVKYKGTHFSGFQIQDNALTIQGEINAALKTLFKSDIQTTTSSRTDAGVHANQNYLHVDLPIPIEEKVIYNLNAIIHHHIVIENVFLVSDEQHARFDARSRHYKYYVHPTKDPFHDETSYFYPLTIDLNLMNDACKLLLVQSDYTSFSKRHTEVNNFQCTIEFAQWRKLDDGRFVFDIKANRFLRGMVRGLVGTLLLVGRKKISLSDFKAILAAQDCTKADFSAVAKGLFLHRVHYSDDALNIPIKTSHPNTNS